MIGVTVDTKAFEAAIRDLSRASGLPLQRVVEYEAGRVLESAAKNVKSADIGRIRTKHYGSKFTRQDIGNGLKLYNLRHNYPDRVWFALEKKRDASLKRKIGARGVSKQAFEHMAIAAGLKIKVPGYVTKAVPTTGRTYPENAAAKRMGSGGSFSIEFSTVQPTVQAIGGAAALQRAVNGRVKFFERNLRLGVFRDLEKVGKKYPGLVVT